MGFINQLLTMGPTLAPSWDEASMVSSSDFTNLNGKMVRKRPLAISGLNNHSPVELATTQKWIATPKISDAMAQKQP